ncbi:hypothetical protein DFS34DRAFT_627124 [Phlyctochytrium arcticum]|nr:hypothetical protein DFS34DRAFT_627124 [Phlyctochytrium arcticum]
MGSAFSSCFGSEDHHSTEESGPLDESPTERTRLLAGNAPQPIVEPTIHNIRALNEQREQEALKRIVQRTADNLIDISSIRMLDRIQPDHAVQRAQEYADILKDIQPQLAQCVKDYDAAYEKSLGTLMPRMPNLENVLYQLNRPLPSQEELDGYRAIMRKMSAAMREFKVQPVGDLVVDMNVTLPP